MTEALRSGALGYVVRQSDSTELTQAIRMAARGRHDLGPPLNQDVLDVWMARAARRVPDPYQTLTSREREILQLVAEGYSSTGIARRLAISARIAEAHRANAMRKLRLRNQAALIRYALSRGVLSPSLPLPREARAPPRAPALASPPSAPSLVLASVPPRDDLRGRALAFIRKTAPFAYCDACLALRLESSLAEMAAVLPALTTDGECVRRRRACYGCGRTLEITALADSPPRR